MCERGEGGRGFNIFNFLNEREFASALLLLKGLLDVRTHLGNGDHSILAAGVCEERVDCLEGRRERDGGGEGERERRMILDEGRRESNGGCGKSQQQMNTRH